VFFIAAQTPGTSTPPPVITSQPANQSALVGGNVTFVAAITVGTGGDNIGVYVPLFASATIPQRFLLASVFLLMTGVWLALAWGIVANRLFGHHVRKVAEYLLPVVLVGLGVVLVRTAPAASLAAVAATLAVLVAISQVTRRTFHGLGTVEHRWQESTLRTLAQALEGIKEVRLRGRESFVVERFAHERTQTLLVRHRFLTLSGISRLLLETTFVFGILSVVLVLAWSGSGRVGLVPVLAVYAYAGFRLIPGANRLQLHLANIRYGMPAIDRLRRDLDRCEGAGAVAGGGSTGAPLAFELEVVLDEVWYAYDRESAPVLQDLHLSIHRGESVGIVGATGAGKTTLVHLLLGFLVPSGGRVLVDGRDIHDDLRAWQRRIGFVPLAVHLIDDTLARNVAFCIPDDMVDPARVTVALRRAQLHEFVASQPAGLQTVLGERGVRLSGGERQRVAIARALYDDPDVLVFDEGTSSLDSRTEREMTRAIEGLYGEKTLIVVAHRLATVRGCDRIVLLEGGRIAATGSFDELARDHAGFRRLAAMAEGPAEDGQRGTEPPARVP
jgi:ATP-binding cassette subfamily C protein